MNSNASRLHNLPAYRSHKELRASRIKEIFYDDSGDAKGALLVLDDGDFRVTSEYLNRNRPVAGGYYVVYKDGREGFLTSIVLNSGYTRV